MSRKAKTPEQIANNAARRRARYQERKLSGKCIDCAAGLQEDDGLRCVECEESATISKMRYNRSSRVRRRTRRIVNKRRNERRAAGLCIACGVSASPRSKLYCDEHLAARRVHQLNYRARRRAGMPTIQRKSRADIQIPSDSAVGYVPIDAIESSCRVRLFLTMLRFDWIDTRELFDVLGVPEFDAARVENTERNALARYLSRMVVDGFADRRGTHGKYEYKLNDTGKSEAAKIRNGENMIKRAA